MSSELTREEMERRIRKVLPGASFDEDNDGQIVIYTDKMDGEDGKLIDFVAPEGDEE